MVQDGLDFRIACPLPSFNLFKTPSWNPDSLSAQSPYPANSLETLAWLELARKVVNLEFKSQVNSLVTAVNRAGGYTL
jgi:hypothetical protein